MVGRTYIKRRQRKRNKKGVEKTKGGKIGRKERKKGRKQEWKKKEKRRSQQNKRKEREKEGGREDRMKKEKRIGIKYLNKRKYCVGTEPSELALLA